MRKSRFTEEQIIVALRQWDLTQLLDLVAIRTCRPTESRTLGFAG